MSDPRSAPADLFRLATVSRRKLGASRTRRGFREVTAEHTLETFLCLRGLRTLPLRLERSQANAAVLAQRLSQHPDVHEVYPGLASHPQHDRAQATLAGGGFMLTFRVRGGAARADALLDAVRVLTHATSLGGVETTLERRARYPAERDIPEDLLRVSVGCEHVEDLWEDLQQALDATRARTRAG